MGVSLRRFQGWEPRRFTHDADGNLLTVTTVEPEWSAVERNVMRAYMDIEADRCGGCGGLRSDTGEPDMVYSVETFTCHKCKAHDNWRNGQAKADKELEGTWLDPVPGRQIYSTARPLTDDERARQVSM